MSLRKAIFDRVVVGVALIFALPVMIVLARRLSQRSENGHSVGRSPDELLCPNRTPAPHSARQPVPDLFAGAQYGQFARQSAVENWFLHGNGNAKLFNVSILAAGDCGFDTFAQPNLTGLHGLSLLSSHISIYHSGEDEVLDLSQPSMAGNALVLRLMMTTTLRLDRRSR
jgi:hypothetical protein